MSKNSSMNKNIVFNTVKSIFGIIYPLIAFPYISRVLMPENIGKLNFGESVVSYFSLLASLGVTTYAIRECSRVREDKEELGRVSSQILSINLCSMLLSYLILAAALLMAKPLLDYRVLIVIQSSAILFNILGADWLNTAMEDFKFICIRTVGMQVLSLALMFLFVKKPEDYLIFAVISVIASSGANVINIFYRKKYCKTRLTFHMDLKRHLRPILLLFSMLFSQIIYCNSDMTMLGLIKGDYEVGLYGTSVKMYNLVNTVVASVAWVVMPQLSVNFARKNYEEINRLLKYSLNFIIVLGLPCFFGINVIAPELIYILAGDGYMGAVGSLRILTFALLFSFISGWIGNMMMLPSGRENICLRSGIICAAVNVALNMILIPRWGLNAAAFTTAAAELLGIILKYPYIEREIHVEGMGEMLKAPIAGSVCIFLVGFFAKKWLQSEWAVVLFTVPVGIVVYGISLMLLKNKFVMGFISPFISKRRKEK